VPSSNSNGVTKTALLAVDPQPWHEPHLPSPQPNLAALILNRRAAHRVSGYPLRIDLIVSALAFTSIMACLAGLAIGGINCASPRRSAERRYRGGVLPRRFFHPAHVAGLNGDRRKFNNAAICHRSSAANPCIIGCFSAFDRTNARPHDIAGWADRACDRRT